MNLEGATDGRSETVFAARLDVLAAEAERTATLVGDGDLDAAVAACPGWDVRRLTLHLGHIHRWATDAVVTGARPETTEHDEPAPDAPPAAFADWLRAGAGPLVEAIRATGPSAPTWHPFPADQRSWFWARRQALETTVHRWDVEHALTGAAPLDDEIALTGIHEFFDSLLPRVFVRESARPPATSLHVHCIDDGLPDGDGEWIVWSDGGSYRMERAHRKGDAAMRGHAVDLLLVLMGRESLDRVDVVGDPVAASAWLDLPGL